MTGLPAAAALIAPMAGDASLEGSPRGIAQGDLAVAKPAFARGCFLPRIPSMRPKHLLLRGSLLRDSGTSRARARRQCPANSQLEKQLPHSRRHAANSSGTIKRGCEELLVLLAQRLQRLQASCRFVPGTTSFRTKHVRGERNYKCAATHTAAATEQSKFEKRCRSSQNAAPSNPRRNRNLPANKRRNSAKRGARCAHYAAVSAAFGGQNSATRERQAACWPESRTAARNRAAAHCAGFFAKQTRLRRERVPGPSHPFAGSGTIIRPSLSRGAPKARLTRAAAAIANRWQFGTTGLASRSWSPAKQCSAHSASGQPLIAE